MSNSIPFPALGWRQSRAHPDGNSEHHYGTVVQSSRWHVDTNEYFYNEFECLYEKVTNFVNKFFCQTNPTIAAKKLSWWLRDLSPEFLSYTGMVVHVDEYSGGWDRILSEPTQRLYLLVGILARVFESKIFGELLFGATERQRLRLEKNERVLFLEHEEGLSNTTCLRY
jgi:hypothetical protein